MNDALVVGRRQSMSDLDSVVDRFANRQRAALQYLTERFANEQLGYQIRCVLEDAELVDGENVGMVQSRCGLRFLLKAMQPVGVPRNAPAERKSGYSVARCGAPMSLQK